MNQEQKNEMTTLTESNETKKQEAEKDEMSGAWPLWLMALSPLVLLIFSAGDSIALFLVLCWALTVGIFFPCVLIYFARQRHFAATNVAVLLLLLNIGIAWAAYHIAIGIAM